MRTRIGVFFAWLGGLLLMLFIISMIGSSARIEYFLFGAITLIGGISLIFRNRTPSPPSQRFSLLRRVGRKKTKETKEN